jgi:hypothetical protein
MKKIFAIALIGLHLLFTTGVKVSMHFCKDTLKSVSISKTSVEVEPCCKVKSSPFSSTSCTKSSCCEDTSATLLVLSSYAKDEVTAVAPVIITTLSSNVIATSIENETHTFSDTADPPILQGRAIYLTTTSFCFYG